MAFFDMPIEELENYLPELFPPPLTLMRFWARTLADARQLSA